MQIFFLGHTELIDKLGKKNLDYLSCNQRHFNEQGKFETLYTDRYQSFSSPGIQLMYLLSPNQTIAKCNVLSKYSRIRYLQNFQELDGKVECLFRKNARVIKMITFVSLVFVMQLTCIPCQIDKVKFYVIVVRVILFGEKKSIRLSLMVLVHGRYLLIRREIKSSYH